MIHFEVPFQDHEQYPAGRTEQRGGPQVAHVCSMVCGMQIHFFKKHSIWHELYCKNTSLPLATQAVTDEQRNFVTNSILLRTSVLCFPISQAFSLTHTLSVGHVWTSFVVFTLHGPVWLPCMRSCCVPGTLCGVVSSRSHRRCNNGFAFLRFLEFCVVAGNKSNCNLVNFYCKLQL